jgi:hypothetical protein
LLEGLIEDAVIGRWMKNMIEIEDLGISTAKLEGRQSSLS